MKLDLKQPLKDLKGENILDENNEPLLLGKTIANIVLSSKSDPLRSYTLSTEYYKSEEREIDSSEKEFIKNALKGNETWSPLITGQILKIFEDTPTS